MSDLAPQGLVSRRTAELCFALGLLLFGIVMIVGAREMETGWGGSGPEAGYFPLRTGMLIVAASAAVFIMQWLKADNGLTLIKSRQAGWNIARFTLPLVVLIAAIPRMGIYLSAVIYLIVAIRLIAHVRWMTTLAIAVLTPLAIFVLFEFIFRTPLPKGPLGPLLGIL